MTIHESKSELEQLRYLENHAKRISSLPDAITFYSTVEFPSSLVFQKLHIQTFLGTPRSTQSKPKKAFIRPFQVGGRPELKSHKFIINTPKPPLDKKEKEKEIGYLELFWGKFSLFSSLNSLPNTSITFDFSFLSTIKRQCSNTLFPLLGLRILDLRFKGCRCRFLATIYTLCFIFIHNMLICFPQYIFDLSCFLSCSIAFLACLLTFCHVLIL